MEQGKQLPTPLHPVLAAMVREDRLVHGVNIEGEPGTGRKAQALALAGAILCQHQQGEMCGECLQCRKVLAGAHSDLLLLDGSQDPEGFKMKPIRELRWGAYQGPSEGRAKVYIIAEAQLLSREVQNVLLKVIEEPPEDTFFILTCDNKYKLLPTILSRVVTVGLRPLSQEDCAQRLAQAVPGKAPEEYRRAALLAQGSPGRGAQLLASPAVAKRYAAAGQVLESLARQNAYGVLEAATPFEKNRVEYAALLEAALALAAVPELRREWGLSPARGAALHARLRSLGEQNDQNAYLPLLSALLSAPL